MPLRKEMFHWWNHSVSSGSQVTSFFGAILLLNLNLSNYSIPRSEHCPCRLVQKAQHHLPLFTLEQGESGLLRPRDLLPLLRSSNLLPSKFKPIFPIKDLGLHSCSVSLVSFALCVCVKMHFLSLWNTAQFFIHYYFATFNFQTFKRLPITIIEHFISNHVSFSRTLVPTYLSTS